MVYKPVIGPPFFPQVMQFPAGTFTADRKEVGDTANSICAHNALGSPLERIALLIRSSFSTACTSKRLICFTAKFTAHKHSKNYFI